jgi:dihydrofolate reductase
MRKLVVGTFLTLDGVLQGPGGPEEDRSGGFAHGGWLVPYFDDTMGHIMAEWIRRAGGFVLGRKTYEIFAAHWPHVTNDPIAETLNTEPKYVASRTLDRVTWHHATLIRGNVAEAVGRLKGEPGGELQVHGSGDLIQTLLTHHLIDEFRLWVVPVVLGTGKRLFREGSPPAAFELAETQTSTTGVMLQVYRAAESLKYGSFMLEPPTAEEMARRAAVSPALR